MKERPAIYITINGYKVDIENIEVSDGQIDIELCNPLCLHDGNEMVTLIMPEREKEAV